MPKITKYNGGYVIISLNDEDIYEKIERNLYKPILLTDIVINGIEKNDVFTTAYVEGTNIVFKDIYDKDITITQDNVVSIGDNAKHLYRHIFFNYGDEIVICYINNIPYKNINSFIVLNNENSVIASTNDLKNIYEVFNSYSGYFPCSSSNSDPIQYSIYNDMDILYVAMGNNSFEISKEGNLTLTNPNKEFRYLCEKIF